jgi:GNAT superfamily N-acetyltransferase
MNQEVKLEIVLDKDAEKIRDIMVGIFQDERLRWFKDGGEPYIPGYNSIDMQKYHTWDNKYYKILFNETIIGTTLISSTGREHGRIDRFYILPEYQGLGIGSKVIKLIEERFPSVKVWTLDTMQQSPRNHHFYEKNGYKLSSEDEEERYYCKVIDKSTYVSDKYWTNKDLSDYNFRECNIQSADLYDTNMSRCRFTDMDLSGNIYLNSNLSNNRYTNLNLSNSIFGDSNMSKVEICHSSLSEAYIHDINLDVNKDKSHIVIERCELTNSKIIDSNLQNVKLENCNIDGMTINGVKVTDMLECYKKYIKQSTDGN